MVQLPYKTSINVSGLSANVNLQPDEYHVYTNKDLNNTIVTSLFNPTNNSLSGEFKLYPNPVSAESKLTFEINKSGEVQIDILDEKGAKVTQLYRGIKRPGKHELTFNAEVIQKLRGKPGPFFLVVKTSSGQKTIKFIH